MFSPDGSFFLVGSRPISIWDTKTWQLVTSIGIDDVDIFPDIVTADGDFLVTHDGKKTVLQVWDLRFPGSPRTVETLRRPDGGPLLEEPSGLSFIDDDTIGLALAEKTKRNEGVTNWVRFSARTGAYIGNADCGKQTANDSCEPDDQGIVDVTPLINNGFDEIDVKSYSAEVPGQLAIDAEIKTENNASIRVKAKLELGSTKPEDIQRVSVDSRRKLIAAEVSGNRLLVGAWEADRFAFKVYLGEDTFGWLLTPRGDRLALVSLRRLTIVDLKGRPIAKFDGKSVTEGAGLTLINYNSDFSEIAAHDGARTRVFKLYPNYELVSETARNELPRCLTLEQRATYGLSPEPPDWCIEKGKWPFDTPEWKAWLSKRKQDPTAPLPARTR